LGPLGLMEPSIVASSQTLRQPHLSGYSRASFQFYPTDQESLHCLRDKVSEHLGVRSPKGIM